MNAEQVAALIDGGHVYVQRASTLELVWIGRQEDVESWRPEQAMLAILARLLFDERCCQRVN